MRIAAVILCMTGWMAVAAAAPPDSASRALWIVAGLVVLAAAVLIALRYLGKI